MNSRWTVGLWLRTTLFVPLFLVALFNDLLGAEKRREYLSPQEIAQIREAQDINLRIPLFIKFAAERLEKAAQSKFTLLRDVDEEEDATPLPKKTAPQQKEEPIETYLEEYERLLDEIFTNLNLQIEKGADARVALKTLLRTSPEHLQKLRLLKGKHSKSVDELLDEAIMNTQNAMEGSQKALADQEEKFKKLKQSQKEKKKK